jgi:hypothetical protein
MVASASRDQTVRVFDIRAMREVQTLRGHKKEVCCTCRVPLGSCVRGSLKFHPLRSIAVTWHPFHPILVSGGSEGSILHWDLSSSPVPPSSLTQSSSYDASTAFTSAHSPPPRATSNSTIHQHRPRPIPLPLQCLTVRRATVHICQGIKPLKGHPAGWRTGWKGGGFGCRPLPWIGKRDTFAVTLALHPSPSRMILPRN